MIFYNFKTALKSIFRLRNHTIFSVLGLVLGISCASVISAWTIQELMYDKFHDEHENIYMVTTDIKGNDGDFYSYPETPPPLAEVLESSIPDVASSFHFIYLYGGRSLKRFDDSFKEVGIAADSKFLQVFNFPIIAGNAKALDDPNSIILTEKLSKKLFPNEDAIGKSLRYKNDIELVVRGIMKDVPENSSLQFNFLIPYSIESDNPTQWWQLSDATFLKTKSNAGFTTIKPLAEKIWREHLTDDQYNINFIPMKDLRYKAKFPFFNAEHGNIQKLYTFIIVAGLIILLACLNYINLIAAYSSRRTNDVMIRKINGASTRILLGYYLSESIILSIISWILAVFMSVSMISIFQQVLDVEIEMFYLNISIMAGLFVSVLVVGVISGLYPAIISSTVMPKKIGLTSSASFKFQHKLKNTFVLAQFTLSISLTIACLVIIRQSNFLSRFDVGYNKNDIIEIMMDRDNGKDFRAVRHELISNPEIEHISFAGASPVNLPQIFTSENWKWNGMNADTHNSFYRLNVDHAYLDVFQIPLLKGRFFSELEKPDKSIVINQKLQELLGFHNPIGQVLRKGENEYEIIGVVKDFHFQHLANDIQPFLFMYHKTKSRMLIKTNGDLQGALALVKAHHELKGDFSLIPSFIADKYDELYASEHKISIAIVAFTIVSIILSCIGLIGLISFNTEIKTKEIAIRKAHGAKVSEITLLLNTSMIKWFAIAFAISCAISYSAMNKWLSNFTFRIDLPWWIFALGAMIILVTTLFTISWQTWKAAIKKPIDALKHE